MALESKTVLSMTFPCHVHACKAQLTQQWLYALFASSLPSAVSMFCISLVFNICIMALCCWQLSVCAVVKANAKTKITYDGAHILCSSRSNQYVPQSQVIAPPVMDRFALTATH